MKILCFGDSNTYGYDPRGFFSDRYDVCWCDLLAERTGYQVINGGSNGRAIPGSGRWMDAYVKQYAPDQILILLGTNDLLMGHSPARVLQNMEGLLNHIREICPAASITLLSLPPIHIWEEDFSPRLAEVNDGYRGLAAEKELRFVDAAAWELPMAFDGIHLSEEGHRVLAEKLAPKIKVTEVVAALIWDGDRFMICQRPAHKARGLLWEFVGGKVEPGETKAEALIRECREELGVTVTVGRVFMELLHEYPDITIRLTLLHAAIAEGIPQKLEHNDIRWITKEEIPLYDFCPADKEILAAIQERL